MTKLLYSYHEHMHYDAFGSYLCVFVCVSGDNLRTIADNCFQFGSYIYWRKSRTSSHVEITDQGKGRTDDQGHAVWL